MRTLLGMQYGGNVQQQYPRRQLQFQPQSFQEGGGVGEAGIQLQNIIRGLREESGLYDVDKDKDGNIKGVSLRKYLKDWSPEVYQAQMDSLQKQIINTERDFYKDKGGYPEKIGSAPMNPLMRRILEGEGYTGAGYQDGGDVQISPAYASLFRKKKKQLALDAFGEEQTEQIEKQKKAGLFGSVASLGAGAGASWLAPLLFSNPATAPFLIPLLIGGASGAGKYVGEQKGYGEEQDVDTDMLYAKEAGLEDIERAGEDYQSGIGERALLSGLKSGLTAGFAPDSSNMFGKIAGREYPGKSLYSLMYPQADMYPG